LKSRAKLDLRLSGPDVGESLFSVLAPDNEGAPRGLRLSMTRRGASIGMLIESDSISTVISNLLALLRDVALFEEVWLLSHGTGGRVQRA